VNGLKVKSLEAVICREKVFPYITHQNSNIIFCPFRFIMS